MQSVPSTLQKCLWMDISGAAQGFQALTFPNHPCGLALQSQCCKNLFSEFALDVTLVKYNFKKLVIINRSSLHCSANYTKLQLQQCTTIFQLFAPQVLAKVFYSFISEPNNLSFTPRTKYKEIRLTFLKNASHEMSM